MISTSIFSSHKRYIDGFEKLSKNKGNMTRSNMVTIFQTSVYITCKNSVYIHYLLNSFLTLDPFFNVSFSLFSFSFQFQPPQVSDLNRFFFYHQRITSSIQLSNHSFLFFFFLIFYFQFSFRQVLFLLSQANNKTIRSRPL